MNVRGEFESAADAERKPFLFGTLWDEERERAAKRAASAYQLRHNVKRFAVNSIVTIILIITGEQVAHAFDFGFGGIFYCGLGAGLIIGAFLEFRNANARR